VRAYSISISNLRRRRARAGFLVVGLGVGISAVVALVSISKAVNAGVARTLDEYGANIVVTPRRDNLPLSYGGVAVSGVSSVPRELRSQDEEKIWTIKNRQNLGIVAPKLLSATKIDGKDILVIGVDFPRELRLKKWWSLRGAAPGDSLDAVVGSDAARILGLTAGSQVTVGGRRLKAAAVLNPTGSQDDGILFVDLHEARRVFGKPEGLSLIEIAALCYDCPIEEIVRQVSEKLPEAQVTAIREAVESRMETVRKFERFSLGLSGVVLVIAAFLVFINVSASVKERTREIGVFRAVGFRRSDVVSIILLESLITSALAGIVGYVAGFGISRAAGSLLGANEGVPFDAPLLGFSVLLALIVGGLASLYPALRASQLEPSIALRAL